MKPTVVVAAIALAATGLISGPRVAAQDSTHADLVALFSDWRAFQRPRLVDGVPDYTSAAMAAQQRELPAYQRRLAAIKTAGWPVNQQADWHILRAEMNGTPDCGFRRVDSTSSEIRYPVSSASPRIIP